jgi:hypothetical protein
MKQSNLKVKNHPQINLIPPTPFFNPLKQSVESVVSLMSTGNIGSININNVQSIHIHNNGNNNSIQVTSQPITNGSGVFNLQY